MLVLPFLIFNLCKELTHWKRPWCWEGLGAGAEGDDQDEMAGWHHRLNGHEFEWTPGVGGGQGGLVCCSSWGRKESDMTEVWTELTLYSHCIQSGNTLTSLCPIIGNINVNNWNKVPSASFLCYKLLLFLLQLIIMLCGAGGYTLTLKITCSSSNFHHLFQHLQSAEWTPLTEIHPHPNA